MDAIDSLIYLSPGNMPSRWAHSVQIAKMAQALARKVNRFELVVSGDILTVCKNTKREFNHWYGIEHEFGLVQIPAHLVIKRPFPQYYHSKYFNRLAPLYTRCKQPTLVYTRSVNFIKTLSNAGLPVLWEHHEPIEADSLLAGLLQCKNLIGVVTLSSKLAQNYIELGIPDHRVLVAYSGVDLNSFLPYRSQASARQSLSLPLDQKIVLYAGHLYESKGIRTILAIAKLMPDCQFVLVGGWPEDIARVELEREQLQLANVQLVGHVPQTELPSYLYSADILILPTSKSWQLAETTSPLKLFDYMAAKRPIVASALPNIMNVVQNGKNGLLAESDDPLSFKTAIAELLTNQQLVETITAQAFQDVQKYSWANRADLVLQFATENLYESWIDDE
jgi:glycosyltransferase involved in cell wall biosynthesis